MNGDPCSIEGCKRVQGKGIGTLCGAHSHRLRRYGDPLATSPKRPRGEYGRPATERLLERIDWNGPGGCWLSPVNATAGYSVIATTLPREENDFWSIPKNILAHRYMWWLVYGVCPKNELDHLCYRRNCVNFMHLREITRAKHIKAGNARRRLERSALRWLEDHMPDKAAAL